MTLSTGSYEGRSFVGDGPTWMDKLEICCMLYLLTIMGLMTGFLVHCMLTYRPNSDIRVEIKDQLAQVGFPNSVEASFKFIILPVQTRGLADLSNFNKSVI